jgi:hypothetical protein
VSELGARDGARLAGFVVWARVALFLLLVAALCVGALVVWMTSDWASFLRWFHAVAFAVDPFVPWFLGFVVSLTVFGLGLSVYLDVTEGRE